MGGAGLPWAARVREQHSQEHPEFLFFFSFVFLYIFDLEGIPVVSREKIFAIPNFA